MALTLVKQVDVRGRSLKSFLARTRTHDIYLGKVGESGQSVRKHAIERLIEASESRVLEVRTVSPGMDGAAVDVWILNGDPITGFQYGRVYAHGAAPGLGSGEGRPTLHANTCFHAVSPSKALSAMLEHMADCYPIEHWPQFLWSGLLNVDIAAIKAEIASRNAARAK